MRWRNVTPASDSLSLLVGSEEGGFLSLEEIDGDSWQFPIEGVSGDYSEKISSTQPSSKSKKRKKNQAQDKSTGISVLPPSYGDDFKQEVADTVKAVGEVGHDSEKIACTQRSSKKKRRKENKPGDELTGTFALSLSSEDKGLQEEVPDTVKQLQKKPKKRRRKNKKLQGTVNQTTEASDPHAVVEELNFSDISSVVDDDCEKPLPEGVACKGKKSKLGSRARKLLKRKKGGAPGVVEDEGHHNPAAEVIAPIPEEKMDASAWIEMRLHPLLMKAIFELKFREPTPIQRACIPAAAHKGKDVIGAAETGSGKTLAFGLPILQRLLEEQDKASNRVVPDVSEVNAVEKKTRNEGPLRALIITPTRELAMQICEHLKAAAKWTTIRVIPIVGGMATQKQQRLLKQKPEIVVGTPGRLWELISGGETHLLQLQWLSFFILDEADRMVEKGHFKELQSIIDTLPSKQNQITAKGNEDVEVMNDEIDGNVLEVPKPRKRRQTLVFSATLALPADFKSKLKRGHQIQKSALKSIDSVASLSERAGVSHEAAIVDLTPKSVVAKQLTESIVECRDEEKDQYLYYILKIHGGGRTLVFCTSIAALRRASAILRLLQVPVWPLHAQMQQKARLKAMDRFRGSDECVLVATDVAARGLDVPGIRTVIHYQLPHSAEIYVHRSGRTARASTDGISIALVSPADRAKYLTLCRALSRPEGLQPFPVNMSYLPAIEKRVALAIKVDKIMRKQSQSKATDVWLAHNAEAMGIDMEVSEDEDGVISTSGGKNNTLSKRDSSQLHVLQKELQDILSQPLKPKAFSNRYITGAGMTPLVTKQLQDCLLAKAGPTRGSVGTRKGKVVIIGQEQIDPLEAIRQLPTSHVKRKRY